MAQPGWSRVSGLSVAAHKAFQIGINILTGGRSSWKMDQVFMTQYGEEGWEKVEKTHTH